MIVILQYTKDHCFNQSDKGGSVFRPWVVAFFTGGWYRFTPMLKLPECTHYTAPFFVIPAKAKPEAETFFVIPAKSLPPRRRGPSRKRGPLRYSSKSFESTFPWSYQIA